MKQGLRDAAKAAVDAVDLDATSGPGMPPEAVLRQIRSIWEATRAEVKSKLEEAIRSLSTVQFGTYEEKRAIATELAKTMEVWGFRAKSPYSGQPATLRCRQNAKNPNGYFCFDEAPVNPDARTSATVRGGRVQLPVFSLVDPPPDKRHSGK